MPEEKDQGMKDEDGDDDACVLKSLAINHGFISGD